MSCDHVSKIHITKYVFIIYLHTTLSRKEKKYDALRNVMDLFLRPIYLPLIFLMLNNFNEIYYVYCLLCICIFEVKTSIGAPHSLYLSSDYCSSAMLRSETFIYAIKQ